MSRAIGGRRSRRWRSGFVGKWAIHPAQIEPALEVFSPKPEEVARARKLRDAFLEAEAKGLGAAQIDGQMVDIASLRILKNTLDRAELVRHVGFR